MNSRKKKKKNENYSEIGAKQLYRHSEKKKMRQRKKESEIVENRTTEHDAHQT